MPEPFFKLLSGVDPVSESLGNMTQGIGFPLRAVEGGAATTLVIEALRAFSVVDQDPVGLGVSLQITFGAPQTTEWFDVDSAGNITCLVTDEYQVIGKFSVGRTGGVGESQIYIRGLINGTPVSWSVHAIVDNARIEMPITFMANITFTVGDVITFEVVRDTDGDDSGSLTAGNPSVVGWADSPSASLVLSRFSTVVP